MANIKQQKKRIKTDKKKRLKNKIFKSKVSTALKKVKLAIESDSKEINQLVNSANSILDKALTKKVKKANFVKRKKRKIMQKVNQKLSKESEK